MVYLGGECIGDVRHPVSFPAQIMTGAGLAIGWTAVRMFVPKDMGKKKMEDPRAASSSKGTEQQQQKKNTKQEDAVNVVDPEEEEVSAAEKE